MKDFTGTRIIKFFISVFIAFVVGGCVTSPKEHFAEKYRRHEPVTIDPDKDTILFLRAGEVFQPMLYVVDGKIIPAETGLTNSKKMSPMTVHFFASYTNGELDEDETSVVEIKKYAAKEVYYHYGEIKSENCVFDMFTPTKDRSEGFGIYTNKKINAVKVSNSGQCSMSLLMGGDTYNTSACLRFSKWQTDMNGNGYKETWMSSSDSNLQVWENFGEANSALLVDTHSPQFQHNKYWSKIVPDASCKTAF